MKILYITAQTPWGNSEQFISPELKCLIDLGEDIAISPLRPERKLKKKIDLICKNRDLISRSLYLPLINSKILLLLFFNIFKKPLFLIKLLIKISITSGSLLNTFKNFIIVPKGIYLSDLIVSDLEIDHIHAHWASTPSTLAYIISLCTGITWSFSIHRHDLYEKNMLKEKIKTCSFARVINANGYNDLIEIVGTEYRTKVYVIHVGVKIRDNVDSLNKRFKELYEPVDIILPAMLIKIKGHKYFIDSLLLLKEELNYNVHFYGAGNLKNKLVRYLKKINIERNINFEGAVPHHVLLDIYQKGQNQVVVLPSISLGKGEHEGIPVSLIEAMSYGIPVISTNTGGIPELLNDNCGIVVPERDPNSIFKAIIKLFHDNEFKNMLIENGLKKVQSEFDIKIICEELRELFIKYGKNNT